MPCSSRQKNVFAREVETQRIKQVDQIEVQYEINFNLFGNYFPLKSSVIEEHTPIFLVKYANLQSVVHFHWVAINKNRHEYNKKHVNSLKSAVYCTLDRKRQANWLQTLWPWSLLVISRLHNRIRYRGFLLSQTYAIRHNTLWHR